MPMTLSALMQGPLPVTALLVLDPLMTRMVEAATIGLEKLLAVERATVEKPQTS
jgi:hypothetical protein